MLLIHTIQELMENGRVWKLSEASIRPKILTTSFFDQKLELTIFRLPEATEDTMWPSCPVEASWMGMQAVARVMKVALPP